MKGAGFAKKERLAKDEKDNRQKGAAVIHRSIFARCPRRVNVRLAAGFSAARHQTRPSRNPWNCAGIAPKRKGLSHNPDKHVLCDNRIKMPIRPPARDQSSVL